MTTLFLRTLQGKFCDSTTGGFSFTNTSLGKTTCTAPSVDKTGSWKTSALGWGKSDKL